VLEGIPCYEFSQTMSLAMAGLQPKVWAFAGWAKRLNVAKAKRYRNALRGFVPGVLTGKFSCT